MNPLPATCGRVCTRPCESACTRSEIDEALAICSLKRFVSDSAPVETAIHARARAKTVAVVGSGPAGLAAAYDLAKLGHGVTIFEAAPVVGGMLSTGIPEFRLPKQVLQRDIENIRAVGVEFRANCPVKSLRELQEKGYQAILLAPGAQKSLKLGIAGENDFEGVIGCISFLRNVSLGACQKPGDKVLVIGGGNVAIDCARTALRLGAKEVAVACVESQDEMPTAASEVKEAVNEGVQIRFTIAPSRILGMRGKVTAVEFLQTKPEGFDVGGRRKFVPHKGSEFIISADAVIAAIGQQIDASSLPDDIQVNAEGGNAIVVDPDTLNTGKLGVFAAGDAVTGPSTIVEAIASGEKAALSIDDYLSGNKTSRELLSQQKLELMESRKSWENVAKRLRQNTTQIPVEKRKSSFKEVELGFTDEAAMREAQRCLGCGIFSALDTDSCCGLSCRICMNTCWKKAVEVLD